MFFENFLSGTERHFSAFALPDQRIFGLYLLSALLLAVLSYWAFKGSPRGTERPEEIEHGLFGYIFDRGVFLHRSARQDYLYFAVNGVIYYGVIAQLLLSMHIFYELGGIGLVALFGPMEEPLFAASGWTAVAYTLVVVAAADFAIFLAHYLHHRWPALWPFHAVHHSAEVLTPMTLFRMHPVDLLLTGALSTFLMALAFSGFAYLTTEEPGQIGILGVNAVIFAFYVFGYNLRHSHIWFGYPYWLSHVLISPAMHQIHHSVDTRHWDRNFGLIFSVWDWMFGTLYVPRGYEKLRFGISRNAPNPHPHVAAMYLRPFRDAWEAIRPAAKGRSGARLAVGAAMIVGALGLMLGTLEKPVAADIDLPSLHLEELTWTEIAQARAAGFDTIIVPTAGTEQNGPHAILGKHAHVVRETSNRIAAALGRTLVAPVVDYVPEGLAEPEPTGHMKWPGTITVPDAVFGLILESAAESARAHGFTRVLFVGDSGGNQDTQARTAERLAARWDDVTVLNVSDYYTANGQLEWLKDQGFTEDEIGTHAGIRDTSELMAVHPDGVRAAPVMKPFGMPSGSNGDRTKASAEIGEKMLELKVEAALRQIRAAGLSN